MDIAQMIPRQKLAGAGPIMELFENDQAHPAGMWRWHVQGDVAILERATAADWSTDEDWLKCDKANNKIVLLKDLHPAADNTLDLGSAAASFAEAHIQTVVYATSVAGSWSPNADDTYYLGTNALGWVGLYMPDTLIKDDVGKILLRNAADDAYVALECGAITLTGVVLGDDEFMTLGGVASFGFETADANANAVILALPDGGATDVPLFILGDQSILNVDLGAFNGVTEPAVAIYNAGGDAYVAIDAGDSVAGGSGIYFKAQADEDINLVKLSVTGTPTITWDESEDNFAFSHGIDLPDDKALRLGAVASLLYETADANANAVILALPDGGATDVPLFILGDQSILNTDLAAFNGVTEPAVAIYNAGGDAYVRIDAGDSVAGGSGIYFKAQADEDVNILKLSVTGTPNIIWDESEDCFALSHGLSLGGTLTMGGSMIMAEAGIDLDEALSADGTYCGITCQGTLGDTIVFGDLIYLANADGRWELADADAEATAGDVMLGVALEGGGDGDSKLILLWGFIREDDWNFTSPGDALYVDVTAGDFNATAPSGSGDIVRVAAYQTAQADTIFFNPSSSWVEVA